MSMDEFVEEISGDIDIMVRLFNTENIGDGRDLYNVCYFCGYETMHVPIFDNIDEDLKEFQDFVEREIK